MIDIGKKDPLLCDFHGRAEFVDYRTPYWIWNDKLSFNNRNSFEAVTRLCIQIAYGNFDEEVVRYDEDSEINALEKYAAKFGPSFPVKAYSKVLNSINRVNWSYLTICPWLKY